MDAEPPAASTPPASTDDDAASPLSSGAFAQQLIQHQSRRLARLQAEVRLDRDPEPLHQLRVSLRRLRTVLLQFGPALDLPEGVNARRLAALARRTSLCRDLDVLRLRLRQQVLPGIPGDEQRSLRRAMRRLERERSQAFATLLDALESRRHRRLMKRLARWQRRPHFTPLGQLPLVPWLVEWQAPFSARLFLHPGWTERDPAASSLHDLRKRIKAMRYALDTLQPWCAPALLEWVEDLRQAQEHLGELHDLQILGRRFVARNGQGRGSGLPRFRALLRDQELEHWRCWRALALRLASGDARDGIRRQLLDLGRASLPAGPDLSPQARA